MIKLYAAAPAWGLPNVSPFVLKVDCYLRMVELPYELCSFQSSEDFAQAPKGKIPYIEDRGQKVADSGFILEYLQTTYRDQLGDQHLSPREQAIALGMRRLMEEHLYWAIVYARYMEDAIWDQLKYVLFGTYGYGPRLSWRLWRPSTATSSTPICTGKGWAATRAQRSTRWG